MNIIPLEHGLILSALLFALGVLGVLIRRDILFVLLSLEIMLNAAGLAFIVASAHWLKSDGQIMFIFILAVAAAEVSVGLALILRLYFQQKTLDIDSVRKMRG
jgi:NADH-quinone oxidoreductase subunit K